jgi:hypothetical protein
LKTTKRSDSDDELQRLVMGSLAGAFAEYERRRLVKWLRLARDHIRKCDGKCVGRNSDAEKRPEIVALARQLHEQWRAGQDRPRQ